MSFAALPAELQIEIFSYLQTPDLKATRAACTQFRENASIWLFRQVIACARYQAMGVFQKVANHAVYGAYVKEIVFDGTVYNAVYAKSERQYEYAANQFEELKNIWAKRRGFNKYRDLFKEQEDIISGHVLLQTAARALEWNLPKVSSLVYSPAPHQLPIEKKAMLEVLPRGRTFSEGAHYGFHHLIGAIHTAQYTGIRHFKIEPRPSHLSPNVGTEFSIDVFRFLDPTHIEAGKFLFRNLRTIDIAIMPTLRNDRRHFGHEGGADECLENIATLLSEAGRLEHLSFALYPWHREPMVMYDHMFPDDRPIFSYLGLEHTWPKLRSLKLWGISVDEPQVRNLFNRHEQTLTAVELGHCTLIKGQWTNIINEVITRSTITKFTLDGVISLPLMRRWVNQHGQANASDEEPETWEFEGRLHINEDGERCFSDRSGHVFQI